jgi:hypothetical protein
VCCKENVFINERDCVCLFVRERGRERGRESVCVKCLEKLIVRSDPLGFLLLTSERFNVTLKTRNQSCVCHLQLFYVCVRACVGMCVYLRVCSCERER